MYSGVDGREFEADIFMGVVYYQRLRHMVSDKFQVREAWCQTSSRYDSHGVRQVPGTRGMVSDKFQVRQAWCQTSSRYDRHGVRQVPGTRGMVSDKFQVREALCHVTACLMVTLVCMYFVTTCRAYTLTCAGADTRPDRSTDAPAGEGTKSSRWRAVRRDGA